ETEAVYALELVVELDGVSAFRFDRFRVPQATGAQATTRLGVELLREPRLRAREVADPEALGLAGKQERQCAQGGAHPILVADHCDALKRRGVTRTKAGICRHRVALDAARLGSQEIQQPHLATLRHLLPQH